MSLPKQLQKRISLAVFKALEWVPLSVHDPCTFGDWSIAKPMMANVKLNDRYFTAPLLGDERFFRGDDYINNHGKLIFLFKPAFHTSFSEMELTLEMAQTYMPDFYQAVDDKINLSNIYETELINFNNRKTQRALRETEQMAIPSSSNKNWGQFE